MKYTLMHGAGNGFVLLDNMDCSLSKEQCIEVAKLLCRNSGRTNADGLMALVPCGDADFGMLFINADGTIGEMCGNGARCISRFGYERGYSPDPNCIRFRADAGIITGKRISEEQYEVRLNDPSVIRPHVPIEVDGKTYDCFYVEQGQPGIPHAVVRVGAEAFDDSDTLRELGRSLRWAKEFPKGANVTFAFYNGSYPVKAITFERGVEDFTLACGTGCGATATSLVLSGAATKQPVLISMPGGQLSVRLTAQGESVSDVFLTGPTAYIGEGEFDVAQLSCTGV